MDLVNFASSVGFDQNKLAQAIDLDPTDKHDYHGQVPYERMVHALTTAMDLLEDPYLGLHLGEHAMLKVTQQVDEIMRSSPTIEEAFENATKYSKLISDALVSTLEKTDRHTKISFSINPNWAVLESRAVKQIIDMTLVCTLKSIYWLSGKQHAPYEVHLNYPSVKSRSEYYRVFDCAIKFNEVVPSIIFHNPTILQSVVSHNHGLLNNLKTAANEQVHNLKTEDPIINKVKEAILKKLPQKINLEELAKHLHVSSRTLQRNLTYLNTNFKRIEKEILLKLSKKLLLLEDRNLEEISYLLGFSEASSFIRFFKTEMGLTPYEFRKNQMRSH